MRIWRGKVNGIVCCLGGNTEKWYIIGAYILCRKHIISMVKLNSDFFYAKMYNLRIHHTKDVSTPLWNRTLRYGIVTEWSQRSRCFWYIVLVVYGQGRSTPFRMPIYPMLNQRNTNPTTPNPILWLVESVMNIDEWEPFSYAYLSNVKIMNIDELTIFVLGQATPYDLNVVNPSALCPLDHACVLTTYPLTQSLGGACCFDRPSQGGAWYTPTCPVVIVRSSLDVYKPWWDRAGEIVVWGQIGASPDISDMSQHAQITFWYVVMISLTPCLTRYDWLLHRTLNIPIDELTWETCFHSDIFRLTNMLVSRVVYTVRHETDIKIDERQTMTHRDIFIALTSWTICSCYVWCIPYVTWLIYVWPLRHELCLDDDFSLSSSFFTLSGVRCCPQLFHWLIW